MADNCDLISDNSESTVASQYERESTVHEDN